MTKDILLKTKKFQINKDFFDNLPITELYELYLPIIGPNAIFMYQYLYNSKHVSTTSNITKTSLDNLLLMLHLNINQMLEVCNNLEAIGLMQSYYNAQSEVIVFYLQRPLNYDEFIASDNLQNLLKQKINHEQWSQLRYIFSQHLITNDLVNISATIQWLDINLNDSNPKAQVVDFDKLANDILFTTSKKIIFDNQTKTLITRLANNHVDMVELATNIENSLTCNDNNFCVVNNEKLQAFYINNDQNFLNNITNKINRNYQLFNNDAKLDKYIDIINDYKLFNAENYLISATKGTIDHSTKKLFNHLKTKFSFTDAYINVLVDFCLYKNFGRLEVKYIYKIAQSIYSANITTIEAVIKYLQCINNNIKPKMNNIYQNNQDNNILLEEFWS